MILRRAGTLFSLLYIHASHAQTFNGKLPQGNVVAVYVGEKFSPRATIPPPEFVRGAVCVTTADSNEVSEYIKAVSMLVESKYLIEPGNFTLLEIENGAFYAPADQNHNWGSAWNATHFVYGNHKDWWRGPMDREDVPNIECQKIISASAGGAVLFWHNQYSDHYDHFLIDHFLVLTWLVSILPPNFKVAIPEENHPLAYVQWWPPIRNRIVWYKRGDVTCIRGTIYAVDPPPQIPNKSESTTWLSISLNARFHEEALALHSEVKSDSPVRKVILLSRNDAANGRVLGNEAELGELLQYMMKKYARKEEYYVHHGKGKSLQEQFELFHTAAVMVGGDGSAMASMMWSPYTASKPEENKVNVIEGICGTRSVIRSNCPYFRTHLLEYGLAPWINYHHVVFNASSTFAITWIDLIDVEEILDTLWGDSGRARGPNTFCVPLGDPSGMGVEG